MMTEEQLAARIRELDAEETALLDQLFARFPVEVDALRDAGLELLRREGLPRAEPAPHGRRGR